MTRIQSPFALTLLSRDPQWITAADQAGVERIGLDTERLGKTARQGHIAGARISDHTLDDLAIVRPLVQHASVFVRLNPLHAGTQHEVERALHGGADSLMLPGFRTAGEVAQFVDLVRGRAEVMLLVETATAVARLHEILQVPGIDEIMVGLNDLHLEMRLSAPLEVASSELLEWIGRSVQRAGLRFGFGGVARPESDDLPVPSDLVLARYAQLNARAAWISRSFFQGGLTPEQFPAALERLRERLAYWFAQPAEELAKMEEELRLAIRRLHHAPTNRAQLRIAA